MDDKLETLIGSVRTHDFEESGSLLLDSMMQKEGCMVLELSLKSDADSAVQCWLVECAGVRDFCLNNTHFYHLSVESEHPLLWRFTKPSSALYFNSAAADPAAVYGALMIRHQTLMKGWASFKMFCSNDLAILASPMGQIAQGPLPVLEAYAEVLGEHGVRWSIVPPHRPEMKEGSLSALVFGESWVVAERFSATRVNVPAPETEAEA